jgi:hypothetical protein
MYIPVQYQKLFKLLNKLLVLFKFANKYLKLSECSAVVSPNK